ncbi:MAG: hypothetical protein RLY93_11115 [Sumerlaeia bacterium]
MFGQVLKQWFWDCYDHLGRLLALNLVLFFLFLPVALYSASTGLQIAGNLPPATAILLICAALIVLVPLVGTLWFGALLPFAGQVSQEKDPPFRYALTGLKMAWGRLARFFLLTGSTFAILLLNLWFYFSGTAFSGAMPVLTSILGGLCLWLIALLALVTGHALPLLVRQNRGALSALKVGFLLTAKYPLLTIGAGLFLASLWVIGTALRFVGVIGFAFSGTALFLNSLHDVILEAESRQLTRDPAAENDPEERPTSWREIREAENQTEDERIKKARYERSFRDILRPWED